MKLIIDISESSYNTIKECYERGELLTTTCMQIATGIPYEERPQGVERDVVGYEGLYSVDIFGTVRNLLSGKVIEHYVNEFGYHNVYLYKDKEKKGKRVNRLVAMSFIPNPLNKPQVNHIDGNKDNNNVWNLEWVTNKENSIHAGKTGLYGNGQVKIVETGQVFPNVSSLARHLNVDRSNIYKCLQGKRNKVRGYHFERIADTHKPNCVTCDHFGKCEGCEKGGRRMTDEVFNVMKCFPDSYLNPFGDLILSEKGNVYFIAKGCATKQDIVCKLLERISRPIAKGEPYRSEKRNREWRESLLVGYNEYLQTNFTLEDMYWIYDKLGNQVNHELTLKFIDSKYDLSLVRPKAVRNEHL